jgi:hypothetical protein
MPITGDLVIQPLKAGKLFGVDVDHVSGLSSLVAAHRIFWLQVPEPAEQDGTETRPMVESSAANTQATRRRVVRS